MVMKTTMSVSMEGVLLDEIKVVDYFFVMKHLLYHLSVCLP